MKLAPFLAFLAFLGCADDGPIEACAETYMGACVQEYCGCPRVESRCVNAGNGRAWLIVECVDTRCAEDCARSCGPGLVASCESERCTCSDPTFNTWP